jgi:hypothetical protein
MFWASETMRMIDYIEYTPFESSAYGFRTRME